MADIREYYVSRAHYIAANLDRVSTTLYYNGKVVNKAYVDLLGERDSYLIYR